MATKPRHQKTTLQLWIADHRKARGLVPADLARWTGVTEATARAWESRGRPSADAIAMLERQFGEPAPIEDAGADQAVLLTALERQAGIIEELLVELREERKTRVAWEKAFVEGLRDLAAAARQSGTPQADPAHEHVGSPQ